MDVIQITILYSILLLFIIIYIIYNKINKRKIYQKELDNFLKQRKAEIDEEVATKRAAALEEYEQQKAKYNYEIESQKRILEDRKHYCEEMIEQLELRKAQMDKAYNEYITSGKEKIELELSGYQEVRTEQVNQILKEYEITSKAKIQKEIQEYNITCLAEATEIKAQLEIVKAELADYQQKRQVINEEILRQRAVEEQQDFYRVVLDENAIDDIQILLSIRGNLKFRENLDKLIYEAYIAKPVAEMIKRVLKGNAPSGIYKITRLKTGEIYIGKSTDIKKRWGEHCKTAYGVGTIAHSILHTTIKKDGIENFTFELLEEVPKDKLTEREKYWISFYGSKEYGMNMREG